MKQYNEGCYLSYIEDKLRRKNKIKVVSKKKQPEIGIKFSWRSVCISLFIESRSEEEEYAVIGRLANWHTNRYPKLPPPGGIWPTTDKALYSLLLSRRKCTCHGKVPSLLGMVVEGKCLFVSVKKKRCVVCRLYGQHTKEHNFVNSNKKAKKCRKRTQYSNTRSQQSLPQQRCQNGHDKQ